MHSETPEHLPPDGGEGELVDFESYRRQHDPIEQQKQSLKEEIQLLEKAETETFAQKLTALTREIVGLEKEIEKRTQPLNSLQPEVDEVVKPERDAEMQQQIANSENVIDLEERRQWKTPMTHTRERLQKEIDELRQQEKELLRLQNDLIGSINVARLEAMRDRISLRELSSPRVLQEDVQEIKFPRSS